MIAYPNRPGMSPDWRAALKAFAIWLCIVGVGYFLIAICWYALAAAQPSSEPRFVVPPDEWSLHARATLARACGREVGLERVYRRDHAMIAYVSARRWSEQRRGWSFAESTRRHANLHRPTPRTEWALTLPGTLDAKRLAEWNSLLRFLDRWQAGMVEDPCPRAVTWSGRHPTRKAVLTIQRERLVRIWCGTKNQAWGRRG